MTGSARARLADRLREHRSLLAVIAVAELIAVMVVSTVNTHDHIDGEVYRLGAKALLGGRDLYNDLPATESGLELPFIYPPFAAIVFAPLGLIPKAASTAVIMLVSHLALLTTLYVVLRAAPFLQEHRERVLLVTAAVLPLATISEPVLETITYAQINIVLMALVAVDCLWRVDGAKKLPYPRGLLIGLAAGIKLTPLVFLLLPLLRRDVRTIAVALLTFLGTALLGFALTFDNARRFWLQEMFASSNVSFGPKFTGDASVYAGNQSLRSLLTKVGVPHLTVFFAVLAVLALVLVVLGMRHAVRRRDLPTAVVLNGVFGLLMSPISWSHHWVWAIPGLVLLLGAAWTQRNWALLLATAMITGFFMMGPHWKVPQGKGLELTWNLPQNLIGNAYVYFGLAFLLYNAILWWRARRVAPVGTAPTHEPPLPARAR
ncbi:alpha-1,2-mannosyltransferase [Saccharopolyspora antimicrobica]|uniref:Alpha-1,2-mannosyltransferase n=1 Tax=Saccharopolyspora antimicrobica TaxID=455193 RepID=A0A1I4XBX8_9PSEU|nr:glycosyltransferase 87 family protein [Saccharopolyspora antimicrobica]RKT84438.1 alpha-1,2-mannosyltransferase [Saccharopolyspora antimicrobica]SFN23417.1 alpha-1,2-mannosyltransferase [Saccharopolyspora antimicrobica]